MLRHYVAAWLVLLAFLSYEYLILNGRSGAPSLLKALHRHGLLFGIRKLSPDSGGALSFRLGWMGFGTICLTNLYILRKKLPAWRSKGSLQKWLDFHIFCGLAGPTLIVFHTNFKVGGLVAVSFWSMVVSFTSGVVGRYFYMQLLGQKADLKRQVAGYEKAFNEWKAHIEAPATEKDLKTLRDYAFMVAGAVPALANRTTSLIDVIAASIEGDLRLATARIPLAKGIPEGILPHLRDYALAKRRSMTVGHYQRLMGYWHAFHQPFAIFMYVVSVLHIIAALIFRVNH
jgi:hypothetical protein